MGDRCIPLRTENQPHRRILARIRPVLAGIVEVEVHLPLRCMQEVSNWRMSAPSSSLSEYSSLRLRNYNTNGSLISSSGDTASSSLASLPFRSLLRERAVCS